MVRFSKTGIYITLLAGIFLSLFFFLGYFKYKQDLRESTAQFSNHASFIAEDIWALDKYGTLSYLQLAVKANHYKRLQVVLIPDESFVEEISPRLKGIDYVLYKLGLIPLRHLRADIVHQGTLIGRLKGEQYVRLLFPLTNTLISLLLVFLMVLFIMHLMHSRRWLENLVLERTRNLQKSEKRFHDFINLLPEMVWESDRSGRIQFANQEAIDRFDITVHQGIAWFDLIVSEQRTAAGQEFETVMQNKGGSLKEFVMVDKSDKQFPVLLRSAPIYNEGLIVGARSVAIDISERHKLQEELNQAIKMKAIGLMAGGVAHDLNNILSGVVSYPELLLLKLPEDSEYRPPIEAIRKSGIQAAEVVSDLLTVARGIAAARSVRQPNNLINEYFCSPEFFKLKEMFPQVNFTTSLAEDAANINCSPVHVRKCLMNLVNNGAEAISGTGEVRVTTENRTIGSSSSGTISLQPGDYVIITVRDTGSGILPADISHIFEPFYTKKVMDRSGTGLGLTVVWNTMRDHDGLVTVHVTEKETVFTMYFPSSGAHAVSNDEFPNLGVIRGKAEKILVVDDEERQLDITGKLLESLNYTPYVASSGEEALQLVANGSFDLIILDMIMTPGMSGYETYKKILAICPGQKAVIASGYSASDDVKQTLRLGAGAYITKPFTMEQLGNAVRNVLNPVKN